jgi:hypothetical protein
MMNRTIFFFLEDKEERDRSFLKREYNLTLSDDKFIKTNGWTGIKSEAVTNQLRQNQEDGAISLILFDADADFKERYTYLKQHLQKERLEADIYLFPDNRNAGELETLLMSLANWGDNAAFLSCYKLYLNCVREAFFQPEKYRIPDDKDMFQAYHSFYRYGKPRFEDEIFWDFTTQDAKPLRDFLNRYLLEPTEP